MRKRAQQLWIPGFLTQIFSVICLMALLKQGIHPRNFSSDPNTILLYVPWLVSLPFFGALGSYLSFRAGGSWRTALLASVFPVLALTAAFLLMFPIDVIVKRIIGMPSDFSIVATAILREGISWLLIPGAALLVGGLLVRLLFGPQPSQVTKVADA